MIGRYTGSPGTSDQPSPAPAPPRPKILPGWFIVELMGHRRLAGYLSEETIAGVGFLRIDVPGQGVPDVATQFFAPSSVYALTPTTEAMAREVAELSLIRPVAEWELPRLAAAPRESLADEGPEF